MIGIDLSKNNAVYSYDAIKADGIDCAILKIIKKDGNLEDKFIQHLEGCEMADLPVVGVYNYSYATTVEKAIYDATLVVNYMKSIKLWCAVWLDVEDISLTGLGHKLIEIIKAYANVITSNGFPFGLYTGQSFYNSYIGMKSSEINNIPIWIARYYGSNQIFSPTSKIDQNKLPNIPNIVIWQYSSKGSVKGINGNVDLDYFYYDPIAVLNSNVQDSDQEDLEIQKIKNELDQCKSDLNNYKLILGNYKLILGNLVISLNHVINELIQIKGDIENE